MPDLKVNHEYTDYEKAFLSIKNPENYDEKVFEENTRRLLSLDLLSPVFFVVSHSDPEKIISENDPDFNPEHANRFKRFGADFLYIIVESLQKASRESEEKLKKLVIFLFDESIENENFKQSPSYQKLYYIYEKEKIKKEFVDNASPVVKKRI